MSVADGWRLGSGSLEAWDRFAGPGVKLSLTEKVLAKRLSDSQTFRLGPCPGSPPGARQSLQPVPQARSDST